MRICGKCNCRNDDTRALCRDCGTVLTTANSRTVEGEEATSSEAGLAAPPAVSTKTKRRRPGKLRKARSFRLSSLLPWVVLLLLAGGIYLAVQPPDSPVVPSEADSASPPVAMFRTASQSPGGAITILEGQANSFLAGAVRVVPSVPYAEGKVEFAGCAVDFGEGSASLGMVQRFFGHPVTFRIGFRPVAVGDGTGVEWTGASIGRLELPGSAAPVVAVFFRPVFDSLEQVLGDLRRAGSISISPQRAVVQWP
jgi:hypothetical protein